MRDARNADIQQRHSDDTWTKAWQQRSFRVQFLGSMLLLVVGLHLFTRFLLWVEQREGVTLNDPVLSMIPPADFTWLTFAIIYAAIAIALVYLSRRPYRLLLAVQSYILIVLVRAVMMYIVPLNPAEGLIVLRDPIVQLVGDGSAPTKDLFFSGHTSTMFLLSLLMRERIMRRVFLAFTFLVGSLVIWQHVHYVIDVLVAPFVAFACYAVAARLQERCLLSEKGKNGQQVQSVRS